MLREFWHDETGPEMLEWAVVTVILLTATVAIMVALRNDLLIFFENIFKAMAEPPPDSYILTNP
jgi:Flp pilus assembly pilin Flp